MSLQSSSFLLLTAYSSSLMAIATKWEGESRPLTLTDVIIFWQRTDDSKLPFNRRTHAMCACILGEGNITAFQYNAEPLFGRWIMLEGL